MDLSLSVGSGYSPSNQLTFKWRLAFGLSACQTMFSNADPSPATNKIQVKPVDKLEMGLGVRKLEQERSGWHP